MSLPVDKLFCDYVVKKIIKHLEVQKTGTQLIEELCVSPKKNGNTVERTIDLYCTTCPCASELMIF